MKVGAFASAARFWLLSSRALWAALLWGFAEGTLFFLVPDIFLTATALFSVRRSLLQMGAVVVGSLAAGALMFSMAANNPEAARNAVLQVPFVGQPMFDRVERDFRSSGVWALCKGPMSGVPYKVYAVKAPTYSPWWLFLLVSIPARLERLVITWAMFSCAGILLRKNSWFRPIQALVGHALYWMGIYTYYWSVI